MHSNEYMLHRHFLLSTIMEINTILMKYKAKFMFDISSETHKDICDKIHNNNIFLMKEYNREEVHRDRRYIKALIDKHTPDQKILSRLHKTPTIDHVFILNNR